MLRQLLLAFIGGGVGTVLRYILSQMWIVSNRSYITASLLPNIIASLLLGGLMVFFDTYSNISKDYKILLMVGVCGGFSTFSAFTSENFLMLKQSDWTGFVGNTMIQVFACLVALSAGYFLITKLMD